MPEKNTYERFDLTSFLNGQMWRHENPRSQDEFSRGYSSVV